MARSSRQARSGIATLELVFIFPVLMFMAAAIFMIARADVVKEASATTARNKAWQQRPQANPGDILRIQHDPLASEVQEITRRPVSLGVFVRGGQTQAESRNYTLGKSWNFRDIPLRRVGNGWQVHSDPLKKMADNLGLGAIAVAFPEAVSLALSPDRNPLLRSIAQTVALLRLNDFVQATGFYLEATQLPIQLILRTVRLAAKAARATLFGAALADEIDSFGDFLQVGLDAMHNLFEASRGRTGNWNPNIANDFLNFLP